MYNRIQKMEEYRLPKVILNWDFMNNCVGWLSDLCNVMRKFEMAQPTMEHMMYDLEMMMKKGLDVSRQEWREEIAHKPKLRTYAKIKDFESVGCLVKTGMTRYQRSLVAQLLCGILPLELEIGRFLGLDKKFRYCRVCKTGAVENEAHFLFRCPALKEARKGVLNVLPVCQRRKKDNVRMKLLLNKSNIRAFAMELEKLFNARQKLLYHYDHPMRHI